MHRFLVVLLLPLLLSCSKFETYFMCDYVDAFGESVTVGEFTFEKGQADAVKALKEGQFIVIGGFNSNGQYTSILWEFGKRYPVETMEKFLEQAFLREVKQQYLIEGMNRDATGRLFEAPDSVFRSENPDKSCYNSDAIAYASSFNSTTLEAIVQ